MADYRRPMSPVYPAVHLPSCTGASNNSHLNAPNFKNSCLSQFQDDTAEPWVHPNRWLGDWAKNQQISEYRWTIFIGQWPTILPDKITHVSSESLRTQHNNNTNLFRWSARVFNFCLLWMTNQCLQCTVTKQCITIRPASEWPPWYTAGTDLVS